MDTDSQPPESVAMAQNHPRNRVPSRGSTASIHSNATQQNLEQSFDGQQAAFVEQWNTNQARGMMPVSHQMPNGDIILRPASQMHNGQSFTMDSSMQSSVGHAMPYPQHAVLGHQVLAPDSFGTNASFVDPDSQMMDREDHGDGDSLASLPPNHKSSSNKTSANNELEMRQLFQSNKHRNLQEVAGELHGNERGPNSERTRQVFAMLWINQTCSKGKGSVPRGRVYANYASRCATERITVLNPASFGKLVRVLFPGLKTRRLGVRGESKYHYVNFTLADDQLEASEQSVQPSIPFMDAAKSTQNFRKSQSPVKRGPEAALPSPDLPQQPEFAAPSRFSHQGSESLYNQPEISSIDQLDSTKAKTMLRLSFAPDDEEPFRETDMLVLPKIEPYLPSGTDPDAAMSLQALYRSHCTSLIECIRYCKEKTFFHLYTSFQGTLTMPVQKLFSNPSVAPWIEQCDFILYQRMMRIISTLTLQVVPRPVLDTLRNISERLVSHIRDSFQGQPRHVVQAKEAPATIFAGLLDRALRVNLTAHAAANMLCNPANRDQMYLDWITMVRLRKVAECVPAAGMDEVVNILLGQLRELLDPQNVPWDVEVMTLYGDVAARNGRTSQVDTSEDQSAQNVLDRWVELLKSLPSRFSGAGPEQIVWYVERVGTAVIRDITIAQGKSFGSWWVTKCWIDEMISFLAEEGGFMTMKSSASPVVDLPKGSTTVKEPSCQGSQLGSGSEDFNAMPNVSQTQNNRAPFPQVDAPTRDSLGASNPDDSGIGMRTPDEEFPMDKFELAPNETQSLQSMNLDQEFQ